MALSHAASWKENVVCCLPLFPSLLNCRYWDSGLPVLLLPVPIWFSVLTLSSTTFLTHASQQSEGLQMDFFSFLPMVPRCGTMGLQMDFFIFSSSSFTPPTWGRGEWGGGVVGRGVVGRGGVVWGGYCTVNCGSCAEYVLLFFSTPLVERHGSVLLKHLFYLKWSTPLNRYTFEMKTIRENFISILSTRINSQKTLVLLEF